jgi:mono/diheme cytochrome c family protein
MNTRLTLVAIVSCSLLAACAPERTTSTNAAATVTAAAVLVPAQSAAANGAAIFQTGKDVDGVAIRAKKPPLYPSCAACHRADGSGGKSFPGGVTSADLRHKAMVTDQNHPYTLALIERAVSTGIDTDGKPLNSIMPRWTLSKRDLHDVSQYVLTQLK